MCGASDTNVASEVVDLQSARDIWREFPGMRKAPSLETDDAPATLVIFPKGYDVREVAIGNGQGGGAPVADSGTVVCIVQATGVATLLTNVPIQGSRLAP
jgi:hypothetical protein